MDWQAEAERLAKEVERIVEAFEYHKTESARKTIRIDSLLAEIAVLRRSAHDEVPPPSQRAWNSLLKLVGGMAIAVYNFNPQDKRSNVISEIQNDLDLKGVNLDADTIRKWLRDAAKLIRLFTVLSG